MGVRLHGYNKKNQEAYKDAFTGPIRKAHEILPTYSIKPITGKADSTCKFIVNEYYEGPVDSKIL